MIKKFCIIISLLLVTIGLSGCASIESEKSEKIIPPKVNNIDIEGRWEIAKEVVKDDKQNTLIGEKIGIAPNKFVLKGIPYDEVIYKVKYVDIKNYIQFQYKIDIKPEEIQGNENMKVIGVYNNNKEKNKMLCEFVKVNESIIYMLYNEQLYELNKVDGEVENIDEYINEGKYVEDNAEGERYNTPTGVLIGLKSNRNDSYEYKPIKYSTVWVNFDNGEVKYIDEKDNILIPRTKNFWSLKVDKKEDNNTIYEQIITNQIGESNEEVKDNMFLSQYPRDYSEIEFVGNDYIGVKHGSGNEDEAIINRYGIRKIEKPNSADQLTLENIYGEEGKKQFDTSKMLAKQRINDSNFTIQDTNLRMERMKGRWVMKGYFVSENANEINEFNLNSLSTSKLINYDTLHVSWKKMLEKNKNISELITSPNKRYAIALADEYLYIYEIKNGEIDSLITKFYIGSGRSMIMAEWASGDFVANWDKVFKEEFK